MASEWAIFHWTKTGSPPGTPSSCSFRLSQPTSLMDIGTGRTHRAGNDAAEQWVEADEAGLRTEPRRLTLGVRRTAGSPMPGSEPRDEFQLTGLAKIRERRKWVWAWFFVAIPVVFLLTALAPGVAPRWTRAAPLLVWIGLDLEARARSMS